MPTPSRSSGVGGAQANMQAEEEDALEDSDYSIIQPPLNIGVKNVKQILKCMENGSREVKDILLNECNVIYECKVCLSLFRSLANLLYHKRGFCKKHLCEGMLLFESFNESPTIVVQPEAVPDETNKEINNIVNKNIDTPVGVEESFSEITCSTSSENKQIANESVEECFVQKTPATIADPTVSEASSQNFQNKSNSYDKISEKGIPIKELVINAEEMKMDLKNNEIIPITLRAIEGNSNAVFQTIEKHSLNEYSETLDNKKVKPDESNILESNATTEKEKIIIVIPNKDRSSLVSTYKKDGSKIPKRNDIQLTRRKRLLNRSDCNVQMLKCLKCNNQFTTLKTLYFHMMSLHSQKRMYYPCPFCKTLFVCMYGVTRHLIAVHGRSKDQINNKMREAIRKRAIWKSVDDTTIQGDRIEISEKENDKVGADFQENGKTEMNVTEHDKKEINLPEINIADINSAEHDMARTPVIEIVKKDKFGMDLDKLTKNSPFHTYVKIEKSLALHSCRKCKRVFGRKSSQVSHEKFCIMNSMQVENSDQSSPRLSHTPTLVSIIPAPPQKLIHTDIKINCRPKRGAEKQMHKDFVNSQTLKWRSANRIGASPAAAVNQKKSAFKSHEKRVLAIVNVEKLTCLKCDRKFSSFSNLRRHAAIHIGWTRFKCKYCDYQAYNKSECRHHIERMHSVPENDIDKFIVSLVAADHLPSKMLSNTPPKTTLVSKNNVEREKSSPTKSKNIIAKNTAISSKLQSSPKSNNNRNTLKSISPNRRLSFESKKRKSSKPIQIPKLSPNYKKLTSNYKSVTTSSPTTIILSKTVPTLTVQTLKKASSISPSNSESSAGSEKSVSTRTSPRKSEFNVRQPKEILTSLVTRSSAYPKSNLLQIKVAGRPGEDEIKKVDNILQIPERTYSRKDRPISDWFPKRTVSANTGVKGLTTSTVPRRDSAPVIIGLVPVSSPVSSSIPQPKDFEKNS